VNTLLDSLKQVFDPKRFGDWIAVNLPRLIVALVIVFAFYLLWRAIHSATSFVMRRAKLDATVTQFIHTILRYTVFAIGLVTALGHLGVDTTSVLTSLGVAGLTIGFAARDALSNIISGVFIFWDRPFVIGDLIEIGGAYGRVDTITMRSTRVVTPDGRMLAIPNSVVINSTVASYTNFPQLRLDVEVTVAVTENLARARRVLLDMIEGDELFVQEPAPEVVVKALNDYNVLLEVRVWISDERKHVAERFRLREAIFVTLTEAGVEMPYETFQLAPFELRSTSKAA
jgi:small conductance mechanosensitive channel